LIGGGGVGGFIFNVYDIVYSWIAVKMPILDTTIAEEQWGLRQYPS